VPSLIANPTLGAANTIASFLAESKWTKQTKVAIWAGADDETEAVAGSLLLPEPNNPREGCINGPEVDGQEVILNTVTGGKG
jgi:hypothetical protein